MDSEKAIQLNTFDICLPLPYRVVFLINAGVALWHVNLFTCRKLNIDVLMVLKIAPQETTLVKMMNRSWKRLTTITLVNFFSYLLYFTLTFNGHTLLLVDWFPLINIITVFVILLNQKPSAESNRLSQTIRRIIKGNIDVNLRNNDILLTDTFTSYNKVLVDFLIYMSALFLGLQTLPYGSDLYKQLSKSHLQIYNLDTILASFPSVLRLKQCLQEYKESKRMNKSHLYNAIKYSTAFLPTISMILYKSGIMHTQSLWYLSSFINSAYSFYWDVTNDWNFGFFLKFLTNQPHLEMFRSKMVYSKTVYIVAIIADFQLRFLWIYKLIYVSGQYNGGYKDFFVLLFTSEIGNFILEILEIFRRWVWVFLKIETEYVKMLSSKEITEMQNLD